MPANTAGLDPDQCEMSRPSKGWVEGCMKSREDNMHEDDEICRENVLKNGEIMNRQYERWSDRMW